MAGIGDDVLHGHQFAAHGTQRVVDHVKAALAWSLLSADILGHQALGDAHAASQGRNVELGMGHKKTIEGRRGLFVEKALEAEVFVEFVPVDSILVGFIVLQLFG